MDENEIDTIIVDRAVQLHQTLGPGLPDSVEKANPADKKQLLTYLKLTVLPS